MIKIFKEKNSLERIMTRMVKTIPLVTMVLETIHLVERKITRQNSRPTGARGLETIEV